MGNELDAYRDDIAPIANIEAEGQVAVNASRAMQEVQGQIIMAKKFPRDIFDSVTRIVKSCERYNLAETAMYSYQRGGTMVTGPSIRLAEVIARNWGNLDYGIRELNQKKGESTVESYCWDLETNVKATKVFTVKHERKAKGVIKKITDPRDIYELVANMGSRRMRACILSIIPSDVVQDAVARCEQSLVAGKDNVPFEDRLKRMVVGFATLRISQEDLEKRLGHKIDATNPTEFVTLTKIYTSIKDGMSKRGDWFDAYKERAAEEGAAKLNDKLNGGTDGDTNGKS